MTPPLVTLAGGGVLDRMRGRGHLGIALGHLGGGPSPLHAGDFTRGPTDE